MSFLPPAHDLVFFSTRARSIADSRTGRTVHHCAQRRSGRSADLVSAAGMAIGTLVHVLAASLGLSAFLLSSAMAFSAVTPARGIFSS
jgi:hypothetical protein